MIMVTVLCGLVLSEPAFRLLLKSLACGEYPNLERTFRESGLNFRLQPIPGVAPRIALEIGVRLTWVLNAIPSVVPRSPRNPESCSKNGFFHSEMFFFFQIVVVPKLLKFLDQELGDHPHPK